MNDDPRLQVLAELIGRSAHNLVARGEREPDRLYRHHVLEAVQVGGILPCRPGERWVDLGTGGGIPGLVLACRFPDTTWILADSVGKKARAVEGFAGDLGLRNVQVVTGRAEELARRAAWRGRADGVVARAVARLVVLVELARGFVREGGTLAAVKGPEWTREVEQARWAMSKLRWGAAESRQVRGTVRPTWLVTMRAEGPVPEGFPRRAGVPQRRPLLPGSP